MKKDGYRNQIEKGLHQLNWEITEIGQNEEWWDDEHWIVTYKYDSELHFYLCFIVDPQFEGQRKKGQGIYEVKASRTFPNGWADDENTIGNIHMNCLLYTSPSPRDRG